MQLSRISKIAGISLAGFIVTAAVADKVNLNPLASQLAGFAGAFVGSLVGKRQRYRRRDEPQAQADSAGHSVPRK